jgi:hypothetical protein
VNLITSSDRNQTNATLYAADSEVKGKLLLIAGDLEALAWRAEFAEPTAK